MSARFCGKCQKLIDDLTCPHCSMQTELIDLTPGWVGDYEQEQMEADLENGHGEEERQKLYDPVCPRAKWAD